MTTPPPPPDSIILIYPYYGPQKGTPVSDFANFQGFSEPLALPPYPELGSPGRVSGALGFQGFKVQGLWFRGSRAWGLGFQGLGLRVLGYRV